MVFINGLTPQTNGSITFAKAVFNTLTEEQIAIATAKGWTVASA